MPSDLVDDNGVSNFTDDLGATVWVDDNGLFLGDGVAGLALTAATALFVMSGQPAGLYYAERPIEPGPPWIDPGPGPIESNRLNPGQLRFARPLILYLRYW